MRSSTSLTFQCPFGMKIGMLLDLHLRVSLFALERKRNALIDSSLSFRCSVHNFRLIVEVIDVLRLPLIFTWKSAAAAS